MPSMNPSADWTRLRKDPPKLQGMSVESSRTKNQTERRLKNTEQNMHGPWGSHGHDGNTRSGLRERGAEGTFETIMTDNFPKLVSDADPGGSGDTGKIKVYNTVSGKIILKP